jgi:hypothetical protein
VSTPTSAPTNPTAVAPTNALDPVLADIYGTPGSAGNIQTKEQFDGEVLTLSINPFSGRVSIMAGDLNPASAALTQ